MLSVAWRWAEVPNTERDEPQPSSELPAPHQRAPATRHQPHPSGERAAANAPAHIPPPRSAPPRRLADALPRTPPGAARAKPCQLEQRGGGGGGSMEGESTSAVLSGFVLGALVFQHLNTDSDTVSRGSGRALASPQKRTRARARARARGRRPGRRCPGPARGLPTPPPRRLCAVGAAFSRSRAAPEVPPVVSLFQS